MEGTGPDLLTLSSLGGGHCTPPTFEGLGAVPGLVAGAGGFWPGLCLGAGAGFGATGVGFFGADGIGLLVGGAGLLTGGIGLFDGGAGRDGGGGRGVFFWFPDALEVGFGGGGGLRAF